MIFISQVNGSSCRDLRFFQSFYDQALKVYLYQITAAKVSLKAIFDVYHLD
jgi:hypothetical protein